MSSSFSLNGSLGDHAVHKVDHMYLDLRVPPTVTLRDFNEHDELEARPCVVPMRAQMPMGSCQHVQRMGEVRTGRTSR